MPEQPKTKKQGRVNETRIDARWNFYLLGGSGCHLDASQRKMNGMTTYSEDIDCRANSKASE